MNRIVQIGSYPLSSDCVCGGVEASVFGLSNELSKSFEVHVFDIPRIGGKTEIVKLESVLVHRFQNKGPHQFSTWRQTAEIVSEIVSLKPDICHLHGTSLFVWLMYRKLRKAKLKVVVTVHGLVCVEKQNALKRKFTLKRLMQYLYQGWVEKRFLSQLPMAIVDTEYVANKINSYPLKSKPVMQVIPQGIREDFFALRCSEKSKTILTLGTIGERKGHLLTLKAFELVREAGIDARLVIAGSVADQAYLSRLQDAINHSDYKNWVDLHTNLNDDGIKELYRQAHLFALHSEEESQGIVFAEAMAAGLPVVATEVGGVPLVVKDHSTGLLSKFGDVLGFSKQLASLMTDNSMWKAMSMAALAQAQQYHWNVITEKIQFLYQKL